MPPTPGNGLRKYVQTIELRVEFWGTGETLEEAPASWDWPSAREMGGDPHRIELVASGPIEREERHDYLLRYVGRTGEADGWHVYDTERWPAHEPDFAGAHAAAKQWIREHGGAVLHMDGTLEP
jgi:hypothetical protein